MRLAACCAVSGTQPWPLVVEEAEDPGLGDTFRGSVPDFPSVTRTRASVGGREPEHDEDPRHTRPAAAQRRAHPGNHHMTSHYHMTSHDVT